MKKSVVLTVTLAILLSGAVSCGPTATEKVVTVVITEPRPTATPVTPTPVPTRTNSPTPTPTPTSAPTATPTPLPPPDELLRGYDEVQPLVGRLLSAQRPPSDFQVASVTDWQIVLVPLNERLYYLQTLLLPEWSLGSPTASTKVYLTYTYERGKDLVSGAPGPSSKPPITQEVIVEVRLVVEAEGKLYLVEKKEGLGGAEARGYPQLVKHAVEPLEMLEDQGEEVEDVIELIVGYACGLNWDTSFALPFQLAALRWALTSENFADRRQGAEALGEIGPEAKEAIPVLIPLLEDGEFMIRRAVAEALAAIGPETRELPALIRALQDEDYWVRTFVAEALETMGADAKEAVPVLIQALGDAKWGSEREAETEALKIITRQDFGEDAAAWQQWWEQQK